jgi:hypothetical protein
VLSRRRLIQVIGRVVSFGLAAVIIAGLAGQVSRDRSPATAFLMYLPVLPASFAATVLDMSRRGRALPRARFG